MNYSVQDVLDFVAENDVKFVKLSFCDIFGNLRNISVLAAELKKAFKSGIPFDASVVKGFDTAVDGDLLLIPDPSTLFVLPWRPQFGRVIRLFCDIKKPDGTDFVSDSRQILRKNAKALTDMGYECTIGSNCEFYVFKTDEYGNVTKIPIDNAGCYDAAPLDKCENLRRDICLTLEEMNISPTSSYHEKGAGQNEIHFKNSTTLTAADNLITFKSVVKTITAGNGMYASFMAKPIADTFGNGLAVSFSITKKAQNIFDEKSDCFGEGLSFIAGVLDKIKEITVFANTNVNSYHRLGCFDAPKYISWTDKNYIHLLRVRCHDGGASRIELRLPDPACNPYLLFSLIISAGIDGIKNKKKPIPAVNADLYTDISAVSGLSVIPLSLAEAVAAAKESSFVTDALPAETVKSYLNIKAEESLLYEKSSDKEMFETENYFNII